MNLVYVYMRAQLQPQEDRDIYAEFDLAYGVSGWRTPGSRREIVTRSRNPDEPIWWQGDEEASQSFLVAAGVKL